MQRGYEAVDRALGELVAALPDESAVLIASDHGFQASDEFQRRWSFRLEAELARAALVPDGETIRIDGQFGLPVLRVLPGPFAEREPVLERLVRFFESARGAEDAALFDVVTLDQTERPAGFERPLLERLRQWGYRAAARWLYSVEFDTAAHAFVLLVPQDAALEAAWPGGRVTLAGRELPIERIVYGDGFTGNHHETAVFVAAGGPIRALPERQALSVLDIAPLFLHLAGAGVPDDLPGRLPERFLADGWREAHPVRTVPADGLKRLPPPRGPDREDALLLERLRAMGYVE